jgi:hypothetical protein
VVSIDCCLARAISLFLSFDGCLLPFLSQGETFISFRLDTCLHYIHHIQLGNSRLLLAYRYSTQGDEKYKYKPIKGYTNRRSLIVDCCRVSNIERSHWKLSTAAASYDRLKASGVVAASAIYDRDFASGVVAASAMYDRDFASGVVVAAASLGLRFSPCTLTCFSSTLLRIRYTE